MNSSVGFPSIFALKHVVRTLTLLFNHQVLRVIFGLKLQFVISKRQFFEYHITVKDATGFKR